MSFGSDLMAELPGAVLGTASSGVGSIIGAISANRQAKKQFKYNSLLMAKQHDYELENMRQQELIQRALAKDAASLRRQSLEKAGYNAADPEGTGTVAPSVSSPSTSASGGFSMPSPAYVDVPQGISSVANARLTSSQARLNEIDAEYRARQRGLENELLNSKIKEINQTIQPRVDQMLADIDVKRKDLRLKDEQIQEIRERVDNLAAATAGIRIDNRYKDQLNENTINKLYAETKKLIAEGNIKGIEAELAKVGILVNSNWMTQLLAVLHTGSSPELLNDLVSGLSGIFAELPGAMSQVFTGMIDSIAKTVVDLPKSVWEKIKSFF